MVNLVTNNWLLDLCVWLPDEFKSYIHSPFSFVSTNKNVWHFSCSMLHYVHQLVDICVPFGAGQVTAVGYYSGAIILFWLPILKNVSHGPKTHLSASQLF